jgi:hypothetical protein
MRSGRVVVWTLIAGHRQWRESVYHLRENEIEQLFNGLQDAHFNKLPNRTCGGGMGEVLSGAIDGSYVCLCYGEDAVPVQVHKLITDMWKRLPNP